MRAGRLLQEAAAHLEFEAMGTSCELFLRRGSAEQLERGAGWVRDMQRRLSRFEPDSELTLFNAGAGRWRSISPELEALLRAALEAHEVSGGLVNVDVLRSMRAIGYTRPMARGGATAATLADALAPPPLSAVLEVQPGRARLAPGHGLDLGGIAKGWMADQLVELLCDNCLANLGGDLRARGAGPNGDGWPVRIGEVTVFLRGQAAATSGTWRRRWADPVSGESLHHIIDPRTGRPASSNLLEVSVVASSGVLAETLAKTALLLGAQAAPSYLASRADAWWLA
jgi:thiamine biosynthesis lipoprotein